MQQAERASLLCACFLLRVLYVPQRNDAARSSKGAMESNKASSQIQLPLRLHAASLAQHHR